MNKKSKNYILAIALTIVAISLGLYEAEKSGVKFNIFNKNKEVTIEQETKSEERNTDGESKLSKEDEAKLKVIPNGEKVLKIFNYPEKEEIQFKMFNAMDNFKTCKGEFIEERAMGNYSMKVSFVVDKENKSSMSINDEKGKENITIILHKDKRKVFDDNDKIYREFEERTFKGRPTILKPIQLFLNPSKKREDRDYLGISDYIISSPIVTYMFFYEDWNYTESTFLGRDVYKLEGVIDKSLTQHYQGKFSLIMDKETGIILQFLSFDDNGGMKSKIECTKLELNTPIDESVYNKDTSGYVKK
ncbi:hypothetical protein J2Z44_002499 [Clostridium punense]|uniref:DUF4825 domain-containing protein n=2 Tax=Clostridium TaxID=1485 RepID=A0ABS4K4G5_9CLOT|nr:hypothetical protein [Clostridium punense]MBP2022676.1 hypothetical protein [Clostridium punense]